MSISGLVKIFEIGPKAYSKKIIKCHLLLCLKYKQIQLKIPTTDLKHSRKNALNFKKDIKKKATTMK